MKRSPKSLSNLAAKVSNDISENIDDKETREELRAAVKWWADQYCQMVMCYQSALTAAVSFDVCERVGVTKPGLGGFVLSETLHADLLGQARSSLASAQKRYVKVTSA